MSDFLGRLVERSMGMAETVRPRPISLFEMPGPFPQMALEQLEEVVSAEALPPPAPAPAFDSHTRPSAPASARPPRPAASTAVEPHSIVAPPPAPALVPPRVSPDPEPIRSGHGPASSHSHEPPRSSGDPVVEPITRTSRRSGRARTAPPSPMIPRRTEQEPQRSVLTSPSTPTSTSAGAPTMVPNLLRETRVEQTTVLERVIERERAEGPVLRPTVTAGPQPQRPEPLRPSPEWAPQPPIPNLPSGVDRRREPAESASRPVVPDIHVTIGRLEIRAAAKPAPRARRTPAQAPVMSLDEYLRQRASGNKP